LTENVILCALDIRVGVRILDWQDYQAKDFLTIKGLMG
jgi:hypothetical protein